MLSGDQNKPAGKSTQRKRGTGQGGKKAELKGRKSAPSQPVPPQDQSQAAPEAVIAPVILVEDTPIQDSTIQDFALQAAPLQTTLDEATPVEVTVVEATTIEAAPMIAIVPESLPAVPVVRAEAIPVAPAEAAPVSY
jgi:hypothetical protein